MAFDCEKLDFNPRKLEDSLYKDEIFYFTDEAGYSINATISAHYQARLEYQRSIASKSQQRKYKVNNLKAVIPQVWETIKFLPHGKTYVFKRWGCWNFVKRLKDKLVFLTIMSSSKHIVDAELVTLDK